MEIYLTMRQRGHFPGMMDFQPMDMPIDTVFRALDVASTSKSPQVLFRGNEPFLYPDLEEVLRAARKRNIIPVFETNGLFPNYVRSLIQKYDVRPQLRLYRPSFYSPEDLREMKENLDFFMGENIRVRLILCIDDPEEDFNFVLDYVDQYDFEAVVFRTSCLFPQEKISKIMGVHEEVLHRNLGKRLTLMDCGILLCSMTDAQYGSQLKYDGKRLLCMPRPSCMPDGQMHYCKEMQMIPGRPVSSFKSEQELYQFFYSKFVDLQMSYSLCPSCKGCVCMGSKICNGYSMAFKAHTLLDMFNDYKARLEVENSSLDDSARMDLLWGMTNICMILTLYPEAIECLEEMRRHHPEKERLHYDLGICYWETGRLAEGEDEFRKCARIAANPLNALNELHSRLLANGNTFRARLLQGEIEKEELRQREMNQK